MGPRYSWSDAWLLQSVELASRGDPARLSDILAVGDALNHAIFTHGELQSGLRKLLADGWVEQPEAERWALTRRARSRLLSEQDRSLRAQRDAITDLLGASPFHSSADLPAFDPHADPVLVSDADYEEAWEEYRDTVRSRHARRRAARRR